jgi:hypothetical protein
MTSISKFDSQIYSEELHSLTESEYDEVMQAMAEDEGWKGYTEWATSLEPENLYVAADGRVHHQPEPKSLGRIGGIEL